MARTIKKRIVSTKRHTVGYVLSGGTRVTRAQAVQMAARNEISGVRVVGTGRSRYLQSVARPHLYSLPEAPVQTKALSRKKSLVK